MTRETRLDREQVKGYLGDYLRQRGLPLRKAFRCLNPEHEDRNPSMSYDERRQNVHCFACGATYDLLDLVGMDYGLSSFPDKLRKAGELFGVEPLFKAECSAKLGGRKTDVAIPCRRNDLATLQKKSSGSWDYFLGRGISEENCRQFGLFEQGGRAYFPVEEGGICTGWVGRAIQESLEPRYKNSSGSLGLWNGDILTEGPGGRLFVTEGIIDALSLLQMGVPAVALCGSQNVGKLFQRLEQNARAANRWRFVACGDPDSAGEQMNRLLKEGLEKRNLSCSSLSLTAADGDVNSLYQRDRERLAKLLEETGEDTLYSATSAAGGLDDFFAEAQRRAAVGAVSTGFADLDTVLDGGLYPGLYVLGAISSLGKTSFVLQIADYIAETSADVLYFSLEQSRFELMAKSLSRTSAQLDGKARKQAFTVRQLLTGQQEENLHKQQLLRETREVYQHAAAGMYIREGIADIGAEEIRRAVGEHIRCRGSAPVVVVDYLQILKPWDARATDKQNTDRSVVELKRISRDFDIPVLAISSFNRENYKAAVSMEAFKESGAVEYSSDVLLGLQLRGAGIAGFDVNAEKAKTPRRVELVLLKNRNGIPWAKVNFSYWAKFNLFEEDRPAAIR